MPSRCEHPKGGSHLSQDDLCRVLTAFHDCEIIIQRVPKGWYLLSLCGSLGLSLAPGAPGVKLQSGKMKPGATRVTQAS